jgi:type I restriction enzyme S subunit
MEVMPGYKLSDVGVIPQDWKDASLGEIAEIRMCKRIFLEQTKPTGDIPFFKIGTFGRTPDAFISIDIYREYKRKYSFPHKGDILLSAAGTLGKTVIYDGEDAYFQDSNIVWLDIDQGKIKNEYLFQCYQKIKWDSPEGSTISRLYNGIIRNTKIPLPPTIKEQRDIAQALSDVDALLNSLDRLIAKKRNLKQAAMQQLLTGQTRLPGFSGEWLRTELKHLVRTPITDGPHLTPTFYETGVPFLSVNNLSNNRIDLTELRFISKADDEIFSRKCKPQKGDVLLGKAASVGKVAIVEDDLDFNIWSPIALVRSGETLDAKFLYFQLLSADSITQVTLLTNSSSQGNIGMGDIEKIQISYPCVDEQIAISKVLTSMDMEISALESRQKKTSALKQGMMQELLTGRTRLV